jgi:hypothetical protein
LQHSLLQEQCGMVLQRPIELFGPTRYQWDSGYFNKKLNVELRRQLHKYLKQKHGRNSR